MKIYGLKNYNKFVAENNMEIKNPNYYGFDRDLKRFSGFLMVCKPVEVFVIREHSQEDIERYGRKSKYYLDYSYFTLEYKGIILHPLGQHNDTTFSLSLDESLDHPYLHGYSYDSPAPQKIGKATEKKMDEWISYLNQREEDKLLKISEVEQKIYDFRKQLEPFNEFIKWENKNSGYMVRGGLEYAFVIGRHGDIRQDIKKSYNVGHSLSDFISVAFPENK